MNLRIAIFGLSITSSWGNGHATTYRALVKALAARGHRITFLERDVPWYRAHRDLERTPHCTIELYESLQDAKGRFAPLVRSVDLVILGSYVPDGIALGEWLVDCSSGVRAFYDIDTPVTLARLASGRAEYVSADLIPHFDLYLSFTGGPVLRQLERRYGSPRARALYCAVDPALHGPRDIAPDCDLGYLGTYSADRQQGLERLLLAPARRLRECRMLVAGAQYPLDIAWPQNVTHVAHVAPADHAAFFCRQRFTLNLTRADMMAAGYSPSVRLFEAAACGVPVISDRWPGVETFFTPGEEILIAESTEDVLHILATTSDAQRRAVASAARRRVMCTHTAAHRAQALERYYADVIRNASATLEAVG